MKIHLPANKIGYVKETESEYKNAKFLVVYSDDKFKNQMVCKNTDDGLFPSWATEIPKDGKKGKK